jgi:hypothetical protein
MTYALVLDNKVVDIVEETFDVHESMSFYPAPDGCRIDWELIDGEIVDPDPKTPEQVAQEKLRDLRLTRTTKLRKCDWTQFSDVPESTRVPWQAYRQALRDITDTYTSVDDVVWPTKPE